MADSILHILVESCCWKQAGTQSLSSDHVHMLSLQPTFLRLPTFYSKGISFFERMNPNKTCKYYVIELSSPAVLDLLGFRTTYHEIKLLGSARSESSDSSLNAKLQLRGRDNGVRSPCASPAISLHCGVRQNSTFLLSGEEHVGTKHAFITNDSDKKYSGKTGYSVPLNIYGRKSNPTC